MAPTCGGGYAEGGYVQLALLRGVVEQTGEQTDGADLRRVVTRRVVTRRVVLHRWLHTVVSRADFHTLTSASFDSVCSRAIEYMHEVTCSRRTADCSSGDMIVWWGRGLSLIHI